MIEGTPTYLPDIPPRVQVEGFERKHTCARFEAFQDTTGRMIWRCSAYDCKKRITKTEAKVLGLTVVAL